MNSLYLFAILCTILCCLSQPECNSVHGQFVPPRATAPIGNITIANPGFKNTELWKMLLSKMERGNGMLSLGQIPQLCDENKHAAGSPFCRQQNATKTTTTLNNNNTEMAHSLPSPAPPAPLNSTTNGIDSNHNRTHQLNQTNSQFEFDPKVIRNCRRFIFHPQCNMSVIFAGVRLSPWHVNVAQFWTNQHNSHMQDERNQSSANHIAEHELARANRLFGCIHSSYFVRNFPLRKCVLDLIDSYYQELANNSLSNNNISATYQLPINETTNITNSLVLHNIITLNTTFALNLLEPNATDSPIEPTNSTNQTESLKALNFTSPPTSSQIDFCLNNTNQCPMNVTLHRLALNQSEINTFQQWHDRFLQLAKNDTEGTEVSTGTDVQNQTKRETQTEFEITRAFEMLACIRESAVKVEFNLKSCLLEMLKRYNNR